MLPGCLGCSSWIFGLGFEVKASLDVKDLVGFVGL